MPTHTPPVHELVDRLAAQLKSRGQMLTTAESCTGGLIAATCTEVSGSSEWFERGFVTYSNAAKTELLGAPEALIEQHGAVSEPVARAMAAGTFTEQQLFAGDRAAMRAATVRHALAGLLQRLP
jgi:nicotinamide-nucleotide amidase